MLENDKVLSPFRLSSHREDTEAHEKLSLYQNLRNQRSRIATFTLPDLLRLEFKPGLHGYGIRFLPKSIAEDANADVFTGTLDVMIESATDGRSRSLFLSDCSTMNDEGGFHMWQSEDHAVSREVIAFYLNSPQRLDITRSHLVVEAQLRMFVA